MEPLVAAEKLYWDSKFRWIHGDACPADVFRLNGKALTFHVRQSKRRAALSALIKRGGGVVTYATPPPAEAMLIVIDDDPGLTPGPAAKGALSYKWVLHSLQLSHSLPTSGYLINPDDAAHDVKRDSKRTRAADDGNDNNNNGINNDDDNRNAQESVSGKRSSRRSVARGSGKKVLQADAAAVAEPSPLQRAATPASGKRPASAKKQSTALTDVGGVEDVAPAPVPGSGKRASAHDSGKKRAASPAKSAAKGSSAKKRVTRSANKVQHAVLEDVGGDAGGNNDNGVEDPAAVTTPVRGASGARVATPSSATRGAAVIAVLGDVNDTASKVVSSGSAKRLRNVAAAQPEESTSKRTPASRGKRARAGADTEPASVRGDADVARASPRVPAKDKEEAEGFPFTKQEDLIVLAFARDHRAALEAKPDDADVWRLMPRMYDRSWMAVRDRYVAALQYQLPTEIALFASVDENANAGERDAAPVARSPAVDAVEGDDSDEMQRRNAATQHKLLKALTASANKGKHASVERSPAGGARRNLVAALVDESALAAEQQRSDAENALARVLSVADDRAVTSAVPARRRTAVAKSVVALSKATRVHPDVAFHALVVYSGNLRRARAYLTRNGAHSNVAAQPWSVAEDQMISLSSGDSAMVAVKKLLRKRSREEIVARCEWMGVEAPE